MDASRLRVFQCSTYCPGFLFSLPFWLLSIPYFLAWSVMHFKRCFKNILSSIFSCFWWYGQSIFICYFEGNIIRYGVFGMVDSKKFIFASVFKIFYVIFLFCFCKFPVCVFFFFFFPCFSIWFWWFSKKVCTALERAFSALLDRLLLPKICMFDSQEVKFDTGTTVQF